MSQHELVVCSKCRSFKPVNAFVVDRSKKSGRTSQCKTCRYPQSREWKTQNCERQNLAQRRYRKRASSNHQKVKQCSQGNVSWWEVFDKQRASRELEELGDGFQLVSKKETHISLLMKPLVYSLRDLEGVFDGLIADGDVPQKDSLELFLVYVVLLLNARGIWVNFLILTN